MIKRYTQFVNEDQSIEGLKSLDSSKYDEVLEEVKKMVDDTIQKNGGELSTFIESLQKNPEDVKVEGFINDSDIYDFYLKFRNDIDELLNNIKFYDDAPTEVNAYGLYEYVVKGTERAFMEVIKMIK